jgi:hypothetical protein
MKQKPYKFLIRLPLELRALLAEAAQHYRRSMNSEIVARLEQSFSAMPDLVAEQRLQPPLHADLERMFRRGISEEEERLIKGYRRLSGDKRNALLHLLT